MAANYSNPNSLRQRIIALTAGETLFLSVDEYAEATARFYASQLGPLFNRRYKVRRDRSRNGFTITMEA